MSAPFCSCSCTSSPKHIQLMPTLAAFDASLERCRSQMEIRASVFDFRQEGLVTGCALAGVSLRVSAVPGMGFGVHALRAEAEAGPSAASAPESVSALIEPGQVIGLVCGDLQLAHSQIALSTSYDWQVLPFDAWTSRPVTDETSAHRLNCSQNTTVLSLLNKGTADTHNCCAVMCRRRPHEILIFACRPVHDGEQLLLSYGSDGQPDEFRLFATLALREPHPPEYYLADSDGNMWTSKNVQLPRPMSQHWGPVALPGVLTPAGQPASVRDFWTHGRLCQYVVVDNQGQEHPDGMVYVPCQQVMRLRNGLTFGVERLGGDLAKELFVNLHTWYDELSQLSLADLVQLI